MRCTGESRYPLRIWVPAFAGKAVKRKRLLPPPVVKPSARRLAVEEVLKSFARVAGVEPGRARLFLIVVALAPIHADLLVEKPLDPLDHACIVLGNHLPDLDAGFEQPGRRNHLIEKADTLGFLGIDDASGVEQLLGFRQANEQRQRPARVDPAIARGEKAKSAALAADAQI